MGWRYLTEGRNLSFARANNWALSEMAAERVLLLNNDALLEGGCLEALLGHDAAVVGSLILHPDGSVEHAGVRVPTTETDGPYHLGRGDAPDRWIGRCEATQATTFAAAVVRRRAYLDAGGMDEEYWYGFEDVDLCLRIRERGGEVITCRDARVVHEEKTTRGDEFDEQNFERFRRIWLSSGRAAAVLAGVSHGNTAGDDPASPMAEPRTSDPSSGHRSRSEIAIDPPTAPYGAYYYDNYCGEQAYRHGVDAWSTFFGQLAEHISLEIAPRKVLDAGCAKGFLVEALRDRGIDAYGVDFSDYAIASVREDVRPYCWVGSLTEDLKDDYDLIVCIEVLEHMAADESEIAIANICRHTDDVLFSSTPNDYGEATHINLHSAEWWAERFARNGFFRDTGHDASYLTAWAVRFRRRSRSAGARHRFLRRRAGQRPRRGTRACCAGARTGARLWRSRGASSPSCGRPPSRCERGSRSSSRSSPRSVVRRRTGWPSVRIGALRRWRPEGTRRGSLVAASARRVLERRGRPRVRRRPKTVGPRRRPPSRSTPGGCRRTSPSPAELDAMRAESETWASRPLDQRRGSRVRSASGMAGRSASVPFELRRTPTGSSASPTTPRPSPRAFDPRGGGIRRSPDQGRSSASATAASRPRATAPLELATGELVGLLDHDDVLRPHALHRMARYLIEHPDAGLVYSDEDKLIPDGTRGLAVVQAGLVAGSAALSELHLSLHGDASRPRREGRMASGRGSRAARTTICSCVSEEAGEPVGHVPDVLYGWRVVPGSAALIGRREAAGLVAGAPCAVEEALRRSGSARHGGPRRLARVGTTCATRSRAIRSSRSSSQATQNRACSRVFGRPVTRSSSGRTLPIAARPQRRRRGSAVDHLLFLDGDARASRREWTRLLLEQAQRREVGAVGCRLAACGRRRHEGMVLGLDGGQVVDADLSEFRAGFAAPLTGSATSARSRRVHDAASRGVRVERAASTPPWRLLADVDLCLRLRERGYRIVYTPLVELIRPDAEPRVARATPEELAAFEGAGDRWATCAIRSSARTWSG